MTDKPTSDATPVEPPEGADPGSSGSRWEPTSSTSAESVPSEPEAAAAPPPYVSVPLSFPTGPAREPAAVPTRSRRRLTVIAGAAAAALLLGGVGGFTFGLVNGQLDGGSDVAFNHEGFENHEGFAPPGGGGDHEHRAPSTGGDDGSDT
ncbi:MAG: hypothetical protein U0R78_14825 [Nocardioidaceae bacterium]